jgi:phosphoglycerol transferase
LNYTLRKNHFIDGILIATLTFFFIILLTLLHHNLYPTVFADEWVYSSSARLLPLSTSISPSYFYLLLFKSTNYCGPDFLACARLLNACFFSAALPFIYTVARQVASRKTATWITTFSLLAPINSYTAYFMPESMYFFSFWVLTWLTFRTWQKSSFLFGSSIGLTLSITALIKMHAIFLLPVMMIFILLLSFHRTANINFKKSCVIILWMLGTFIVTRSLFGYLFAGYHGLNIVGIKYNYNIFSNLNGNRLATTIALINIPLLGHLMAITLLFGLPIIHLLHQEKTSSIDLITLKQYTLASFITLLFITIFATAQMAGWGPYETINRIHMRYYNFIFPLFLMITSAELSICKNFHWQKFLLAISICLIMLFSMFYLKPYYHLSFIDCPELFGMTYHHTIFIILAIFGMICLMTWSIHHRLGTQLYLFIFFPLLIIISSYVTTSELRHERLYTTDAYDRAGQFIHQYFHDTSHLAVIGPEQGGLFKILFYIDNPNTSIHTYPNHIPIELIKIPKDKTWVLLIGNYPILKKPSFQMATREFTLIKLK